MTADVIPAKTHDDEGAPLRFITCGSVDDGKSTLIGRLLVDSQAVLQDQLAGVQRARAKPTWRCSPTACPPSASRASPSTWPTATSPRRPQVHHRRRARPRAVHPQHGDGRLQRRRRRGAGRCHQAEVAEPRPGTAAADPPPHAAGATCCACRRSCSPSTSSTRWTTRRGLHATSRRAGDLLRSRRHHRPRRRADLGAGRATTSSKPKPGWCGYHGPSLLQVLEAWT
jgi:hypothetical protein